MSKASGVDFAVVVPLFNHADYIREALASVVGQQHRPQEIILIDDGSRDNGIAIARDFLRQSGIEYIADRQRNRGAATAINSCISRCKSQYVAVLNSDDLFVPEKLQRCAEIIDADPKVDLIFGGVTLIDGNGRPIDAGETAGWLASSKKLLQETNDTKIALLGEQLAVTTSNMVFSKVLWERNGGFQQLRYCHDLEFLFEAYRRGSVVYDKDVTHVEYRVHAHNTIKERADAVRLEVAAVVAEALFGGRFFPDERKVSKEVLVALHKALSPKRMSLLILYLLSKRPLFESKSEFYDWAVGNVQNRKAFNSYQVMGQLADAVEGDNIDAQSRAKGSRPIAGRQDKTKRARFPEGLSVAIELAAFDKGGLEKVVFDTAVALRARGANPVIISCGRLGYLAEKARRVGVTVYQLPDANRDARYEAIIREHEFGLSISHFSGVGYRLFDKYRIPNITFIHNVYAMLSNEAIEQFRADDSYVAKYIAVSANAKRYAVSRLLIASDKIATVPNGFLPPSPREGRADVEPFSREGFGLGESDYVFLNVASYNLHKGHYLMADAMQLVLAKRQDIKILCVGNVVVRSHIEGFERYLKASGLDKHIVLGGFVEDVDSLYSVADAFLLPSFIEGWSIAMNEAMYRGKPMILTDTGGASEVIENNDIGILIPNEYGDVANLDSKALDELAYERREYRTSPYLAQAMISFAENRAYWCRAGSRGAEKVAERYLLERQIERHIDVMREIVVG